MGRITYETFADAWPSHTEPNGFADYMNTMPKFVVSTTLDQLHWKNSNLIKGNIVQEVKKLKQQPGKDILVAGSGMLVRSLMKHDLVDEFRLMIHPVVLGAGKRLFNNGTHMRTLSLKEAKSFSTGIVVFIYDAKR